MRSQPYDPGISQKYTGPIRRIINQDGSFNVHRQGLRLRDLNFFHFMINLSWPAFLVIIIAGYLIMNTAFAVVYLLLGVRNLTGADPSSTWNAFLSAFFFSADTFSTVGYGNIAPVGFWTSLTAALEAMFGWLGFALATGLFYGRFSHPSARFRYSSKAIIAPYQGRTGLEFRIVNQRIYALMDLEAQVTLMTVEESGGQFLRRYYDLPLERRNIIFFPLTWTIVHPIDESSPLFGKDGADLEKLQAELLILVRGFDDTFSQFVISRYSYRYDEILWGARFLPAFHVDQHGDLLLEVDKVGDLEKVELT